MSEFYSFKVDLKAIRKLSENDKKVVLQSLFATFLLACTDVLGYTGKGIGKYESSMIRKKKVKSK